MAGALLADLGADVILVEPPGGSAARAVGPFVAGREGDPEASLWFWSYNRGKRSVALDLDDPGDQQRLRDLAATADVLIESDVPGAMATRGLGPQDLSEVNPGLVYTSVTAFGQSGPKADWAATDLIVSAASMLSNVVGDEDRPPLRIPLDQCFLHASAEAAVASLIALRERKRSGLGQHVDVSAQQAVTQATQSATLCHLYNSPELLRMSGGARLGPFRVRLRSPAADGYVSATILFGQSIGPFGARLFEWMHSEGGCADSDLEIDWINFVEGVITGRIPPTEYERIQQVAADFTATRTKADLLEVALDKRLLIVPITTVADVVESPQYAERGFWRDIPTGGLDSVRYPGPCARFSSTPLDVSTPPPSVGQHTDEVLADVGAPASVATSEGLVAAAAAGHRDPALPLADVKILDFMWVMAGILDLVRWADVVTESFSPHALADLNLAYEDLRAVKPDIIMASSCLFGQSGPLSSLAGFGTMGASMSGFYEMTGWPDRDPAGVFGAYTDYVSPKFLSAALLAALDHRDRTGEGQYIDLSQAESSMTFLAPAVLDYDVNAHLPDKMGNDHPAMSPHGVFASAGDDRWIAVACENDDQWAGLCGVIGADDMAGLGVEERRERAAEIADRITAWTSERDNVEAHVELQAAGVPAHAVANSEVMTNDLQLAHRNHFRNVPHGSNGTMWVEGARFAMSRSSDGIDRAGPTYGEHTFVVLEQLLGYDQDRISELAVAGVLE